MNLNLDDDINEHFAQLKAAEDKLIEQLTNKWCGSKMICSEIEPPQMVTIVSFRQLGTTTVQARVDLQGRHYMVNTESLSNPPANDLSRRAVACKHWQWLPGMLTLHNERDKDLQCNDLPDLSDPATLGCLLALVRTAWRDNKLGIRWVEHGDGERHCYIVRMRADEYEMRHCVAFKTTEVEALVAALEAAP